VALRKKTTCFVIAVKKQNKRRNFAVNKFYKLKALLVICNATIISIFATNKLFNSAYRTKIRKIGASL